MPRDLGEGIRQDEIGRACEIGLFPLVFDSRIRPAAPEMLKFMDPIFMDAISGFAHLAATSRSSMLIPSPAPVVMLTIASQRSLMRGRNCA